MVNQSALGARAGSVDQIKGQTSVLLGRVASPFSPSSDRSKFDDYVATCMRTWSVDVVLDDGQYLSGCRIVCPQGNVREGFRRMLKFPRSTFQSVAWLGDRVVVAMIDGNTSRPVVLGTLYPVPLDEDPDVTLEQLASRCFVSDDHNEWMDRHEVVNYDDEENPLPAYTATRNNAASITEEHVVITTPVGSTGPDDNVECHVISQDVGAAVVTSEHMFESGAQSERVRHSVYDRDDSARDLLHQHKTQEIVGGSTLNHRISTADIAAKLLQLQQQVEIQEGVINALYMESRNAQQLKLQHDGQHQTVLLTSDDAASHMAVVKLDLDDGSNASLAFEKESRVVLRRNSAGDEDSWVLLDKDGTVTIRSATGQTVRLSEGRVAVRSGSTSVTMDDTTGISLSTSDGAFVSVSSAGVSLSAPSVSLSAESVGINSGVIRLGNDGSGTHYIAATDKVYPKLSDLEHRVQTLEISMNTHTHPANNIPTTKQGIIGSISSFDSPAEDSLDAVKAD